MKKSEIIIDIHTQKNHLLETLHCLHGEAVLKELSAKKGQHYSFFSTSFFLGEELVIDNDPKYLFIQDIHGRKRYGVIVSAFNDYCSEMAKTLYFDVLDNCIEEYDVMLNRTGRAVYAKTEEKHDVFDMVSLCHTYLDVWNCIKGKRIRISAYNSVNGAKYNREKQIVGVHTFNIPVFSFVEKRKTNDGKFWGPVKRCVVNQDGLFKSSSLEGNTTSTYYYDDSGFLQKIEGLDDRGEFVTDVYEYRRNGKGQLVEELYPNGDIKKYFYMDTDSMIVSKTILINNDGAIREIKEFDRTGNVIKETYWGGNTIVDELVYEYDEQNRLLKMKHGEYYYSYFYNRIGQLIEKRSYRSQNNNELCHTIIYKYSPNGLLIEKNEESSYYYIGRTKTEYNYNSQNQLVEEIEYRNHPPKDYFEGRSRTKFRYDQYGNCIYREHSDFDGQQVHSRTIVEIDYY